MSAVRSSRAAKPGKHTWIFTARFRSGAYGWKASKLASKRLKEAVSEITRVAGQDAILGRMAPFA